MALLSMIIFIDPSFAQENHKTKNQTVIKINSDASLVLFQQLKGNTPKSAIDNVEKDLRNAIKLDPDYKNSYLNLIECLHVQGSRYSKKNAVDEQINVCSMWLKRHADDGDVLIKRGVFYEKSDNLSLANRDYKSASKYLDKLDTRVTQNMNVQEIETKVARAFGFFIIKEPKVSLRIVNQLNKLYPDNPQVKNAYSTLTSKSREEFVKNSL